MTQATNTHDRYDLSATGDNVRESLSDIITNISPTETPFISNIGKMKVKNILHEWQVETLDAPDADNAQYEGDEIGTHTSAHQPSRRNVYAQIFRKDGSISGTVQASDRAGRADELELQGCGRAHRRRSHQPGDRGQCAAARPASSGAGAHPRCRDRDPHRGLRR